MHKCTPQKRGTAAHMLGYTTSTKITAIVLTATVPPTAAVVDRVKGGLCVFHGREAGIDLSYRICKSKDCCKFINKKGYCRVHARELGLFEE